MILRLAGMVAAVSATILIALSAAHDFRRTLDAMRQTHRVYAGLGPLEREHSYGAAIPLPMDIFDFYRRNLRPGDRYWVQVAPEPFSTWADKRLVVTNVARLYLLPAIQVDRLEDAEVVLSWDQDPSTLPVRYEDQARAGQQLIFVSRVAR